jgi:hypothetical protein
MAHQCHFQSYLGSGAHLVKRWSALGSRSENRLIRPDGEHGGVTDRSWHVRTSAVDQLEPVIGRRPCLLPDRTESPVPMSLPPCPVIDPEHARSCNGGRLHPMPQRAQKSRSARQKSGRCASRAPARPPKASVSQVRDQASLPHQQERSSPELPPSYALKHQLGRITNVRQNPHYAPSYSQLLLSFQAWLRG